MREGRIAAGAASLALTSVLAFAPAAAAAPAAAPADRPHAAPTTKKPSKKPSSPARTQPQRAPAPKCNRPIGQPASAIKVEPWPQRRLDFEEAWRITRGRGVTVAVVDSGINARHPQLKGKVVGAFDASGTTADDCLGHGTEVAGIIAGADMRAANVPFVGVAPQVKLLNAKFASGENTVDNTLLAKAITWAAEHGAKVINVSSAAPDTPALRAAVRAAQRRDALIVAAAGNVTEQQRGKETAAYPASYKGVLSVAAVDEAGTITGFSNIKSRIDVSAPGENVISTLGEGYAGGLQGTSFGAPYAAGVAALVRARHPKLTYQQVINRILITAEGGNGQGSGHGMISPLQAVSALVDPTATPGAAGPRPLGGAVPFPKPEPVDHRSRGIALAVAGGAVAAALAVAFAGAILPLGRRRGWRPGRAALPADDRD
ncbi:type VII secretion-associated serine protease mycosin [Actinomadura meyerae]|uniref:Type VII secretion-associated serine protease mycosin n=1 Tax=Actinomadura meyerae TaxID=240840 RepID=A0A239L999_9ACTN|nr:S8 family serine peptidase [Actinomadura meyerae]SNT26562.1 type VII secretion-associated serine protease mycosin [Actinomadura meyerae]